MFHKRYKREQTHTNSWTLQFLIFLQMDHLEGSSTKSIYTGKYRHAEVSNPVGSVWQNLRISNRYECVEWGAGSFNTDYCAGVRGWHTYLKARLAQSVERKALNLVVGGSSPPVGTFPTLNLLPTTVGVKSKCFIYMWYIRCNKNNVNCKLHVREHQWYSMGHTTKTTICPARFEGLAGRNGYCKE